jgi:hypothetical protein
LSSTTPLTNRSIGHLKEIGLMLSVKIVYPNLNKILNLKTYFNTPSKDCRSSFLLFFVFSFLGLKRRDQSGWHQVNFLLYFSSFGKLNILMSLNTDLGVSTVSNGYAQPPFF